MLVDNLLFPDSHDETGTGTYCGIAGAEAQGVCGRCGRDPKSLPEDRVARS